MVSGPLRAVLWVLGSLATLWLVLFLAMLPSMGRMMGGGMMEEGMKGGHMMDGGMMAGGGMMGMMSLMAVQSIALLGLVGVFVYLVVDSLRGRRAPRAS